MSVKVGDKVTLRKNLKADVMYSGGRFPKYMERYVGTEVTIVEKNEVGGLELYTIKTHDDKIQNWKATNSAFLIHPVLDYIDNKFKFLARDPNGSIWVSTGNMFFESNMWVTGSGAEIFRLYAHENVLSTIIEFNKIYDIN